ncbi:MAG: hypothetical protein GXY42_08825 [Desulfovibrionales bacterium]|nr:hypothetical protein [Desulfovibrionales bacterium]
MNERSKENTPSHAVLRGVIIGGSIGMIASWFGYEPVKAFFMGIVCGIFAAATKIMADRLRGNKP